MSVSTPMTLGLAWCSMLCLTRQSHELPPSRSPVNPSDRLSRRDRLKAPWLPSCIIPVAVATSRDDQHRREQERSTTPTWPKTSIP